MEGKTRFPIRTHVKAGLPSWMLPSNRTSIMKFPVPTRETVQGLPHYLTSWKVFLLFGLKIRILKSTSRWWGRRICQLLIWKIIYHPKTMSMISSSWPRCHRIEYIFRIAPAIGNKDGKPSTLNPVPFCLISIHLPTHKVRQKLGLYTSHQKSMKTPSVLLT